MSRERELAGHMAAFRRHGDMRPAIVSAQFGALLCVMAAERMAKGNCPPDVLTDLCHFYGALSAELDGISPGFSVCLRSLLGSAAPRA